MIAKTPDRFVYFDMGNVLFHFDHQIACRQIADLTNVEPARVKEVVFDSELQWQYEQGLITTEEFYQLFCARTECQPAQADLLRAASDIFSLNVMVVPLVIQLRRAGYKLGILSNTCDAHWQFIRNKRIAMMEHYFDVFALSFELNSMKPDPSIYARAIELSGHPADEIIFLDDRAENVAAAQQAGMQATQFTDAYDAALWLRQQGLVFNY